ncbi:hypothetical protein HPB51_027741 [Rhipicephalus microplus]|uniref:Uncharacterized protein n=1 Tax=Rhipicephalus microplus TaxID=6941 RepID=A0A9J6CZI5_RHIMP|nr:hypothetical protein HPB51_027741 [Rhipicephalus microplus]
MVRRFLDTTSRFSSSGETSPGTEATSPNELRADKQSPHTPLPPPPPRLPPELKRHPLPRLPSHTYHIVGRHKTPIDLTRTSPGNLRRALLKAASLCDLDTAKRDRIRIHPKNNTFTVSMATTDRAIAYHRITSILLGEDRQNELHMYAPPPDDAMRGIAFYAHTFPTDDETLKDLQESNPDYQIVGNRRMAKAKNLLITLLGDHLPRWLLHCGGLIRVYLFFPKQTHASTAGRLGTTPMCALNLGTDAACVTAKTTSHRRKERHQHAKHAVSSVKEDTLLTAQNASTSSPKSLNHLTQHK